MPPNNATVVCYICRHGRTGLNAKNAFRGNANPPLDDVGLKQAATLADLFKDKYISHIFCSDKQRSVKTAEIIAAAKGAKVHSTESLRALDVGDFSGTARTPESEANLQQYLDRPDTQIPGGESLNEFKARIAPCLQEAIDLFCDCGSPPLIVGHSSIIHEIGSLIRGSHTSVLVEPGGAIAVYSAGGKLSVEPIFKPVKAAKVSQAGTIT